MSATHTKGKTSISLYGSAFIIAGSYIGRRSINADRSPNVAQVLDQHLDDQVFAPP